MNPCVIRNYVLYCHLLLPCVLKRSCHCLVVDMENDAPYSKRMRLENINSDSDAFMNLSEFSTDPSQQSQYEPVTREEWTRHCVPARKTPAAAAAAVSACTSTPSHKPIQKHMQSPVHLLDKLMSMVEPIEGKGNAVRQVTRELRSALRNQSERLKKDCPVGNVPDNIKAWSTGVPGQCSECGMHHFLVELLRIANKLYGSTTAERKYKITKWFDEGTDEYVSEIRDLIVNSWIGQLLTEITAQGKVTQKSNGQFVAVKQTQVSAHTLTHDKYKEYYTYGHVHTLRISLFYKACWRRCCTLCLQQNTICLNSCLA